MRRPLLCARDDTRRNPEPLALSPKQADEARAMAVAQKVKRRLLRR